MDLLVAIRFGLLTAGCLAVSVCHAAGQCTQAALPPHKVPPELLELVPQMDEGRFVDTICKKWASLALGVSLPVVTAARGADVVRDAPWTIIFDEGVLQCSESNDCTVSGLGDVNIQVRRAEPRIHAANVVLAPNSIRRLLAHERIRYVAPNCTAFPQLDELQPPNPGAAHDLPAERFAGNTEQGCERTDSAQWGMSDACVPASRKNAASLKPVAVLDSGIDCRHPAIHDRIAGGAEPVASRRCPANAGVNYVHPGLPPDNCNDAKDLVCTDHGTAVAGVIASYAPEVPGVDPAAELVSMRVLKEDSDLRFVSPWMTVATAILDSGRDARIINISANWYENVPELAAAIDRVTADGEHLIVGAARSNGHFPAFPAAYTKCNDAVVGVSHIHRSRSAEQQYDWGPKADDDEAYMVAPGVRVLSSYSDHVVRGAVYKIQVGASLATPHVSGAASLIWSTQEFETCSAVGVRELLECSSRVTAIGKDQDPRKRLHLGCLFSQRKSPICRGAQRCIDSVKTQFCSR
jgi:subtilisin family serine protease